MKQQNFWHKFTYLPYTYWASLVEYKPIVTNFFWMNLFFLFLIAMIYFFHDQLVLHPWLIVGLCCISVAVIKKAYDFLLNWRVYSNYNKATRMALNQLEVRFKSMQAVLRSKKNHQGVYLKSLPKIALIGATGAGKTSLLKQSELHFILQKKITSLREATQSPQWFVSEKHCYIDVPGKYFSSKIAATIDKNDVSQGVLWQHFWKHIKNENLNQLNAFMICVPLAENLLTQSPKKHLVFWRFLAKRLHDIQMQFPQVPCYLILTKCDLIKGFSAFFSDLSLEESQQSYGVQLSLGAVIGEQIEVINQLYTDLLHRIKHQMMQRLHRESDPLEKINILQFPSSLEELKNHLITGLKYLASRSSKISLSGIYFTSAYRHDFFDMQPNLSASTHFLPSITVYPELSRPYFIHQLLLKNRRPLERTSPWIAGLPFFSYGVSAIILFLAGSMALDFFNGQRMLQQLSQINAQYQRQLSQPFEAKKNLRADMQYYESLKKLPHSHFAKWQYFSNAAENVIEKNQNWFINQQLLLSWQQYLAEELSRSDKNSTELYKELQSYLMLGGALSKDPIALKKLFLSRADFWRSIGLSDDYLNLCMQQASQTKLLQLPLHREIVAHARQMLWSRPVTELAMLILDSQEANSGQLSLLNVTKPLIFYTKQPAEIKKLYTATQLQAVFSDQLNAVLQFAIHGNAILGLPFSPRVIDEKIALSQLQQLYLKKYVSIWENAIFDLRLSEPKNLREADDMIAILISDHSPLLSLLRLVHEHTYFSPMTEMSPSLQMLGGLWLGQNNSALLLRIFSKLKAVHEYLQPILLAENPQKAAYIALATRRPEDKPSVLTDLYLVAEDCPEPLKQWLRRLANHTWRQLLLSSNAYMNTALKDEKIKTGKIV